MSVVKADRFTALKAKVKAEMLRRSKTGSVAAYGGSGYDYAQAPAQGGVVRAEHRDKLITPMRAVNSDLVDEAQGSAIREEELANLETRVEVWAARSITDRSGSDCKSGCTGTCYTGCATGCSGCGSGCPNGCSSCGSGCPNACTSCGSGCATGCYGCTGYCADGCGSGCGTGCDSCSVGCTSSCDGKCSSSCTGICAGGGRG